MKKQKYICPVAEIIQVKLLGGVLEKTAGVDNTTARSKWEWAADGKRQASSDFDDADNTDQFSPWDDESESLWKE